MDYILNAVFYCSLIIIIVCVRNCPFTKSGDHGIPQYIEAKGPFKNARWQALNHQPPPNQAAQFNAVNKSLSWSKVENDIPRKSPSGSVVDTRPSPAKIRENSFVKTKPR